MKWNHILSLTIALSGTAWQSSHAATNFWQDANESYQARAAVDAASVNVMVKAGRRLTADVSEMQAEFSSEDNLIFSLPLPDGSMADYQFSRSTVMPEELARKYPQIQTFKAVDINNSANSGRFDITPQGFHGMFQHDGKWVFIDPEMRNDDGNYVAYYGSDAQPLETRSADKIMESKLLATDVTSSSPFSARPLAGSTLRTYRLAMAAAAEYTSFHGGKTGALSAIATLMNRVNEVYERDLSISFVLVSNNDDLIYTNRITDPYDNTSDDAEANAVHLPTVVPSTDFDIGHVVNTDGGGLAYLSGVCQDTFKSIGMTGASQPTGDAFYIDYVAHELGHQLGANHTFNGTSFACGNGNRTARAAWEPGSGSTIMGYAGICGTQDLQVFSDPQFHTGSIQQMLENADSAGCGTVTTVSNTIPVADAGADFTIPANTPFKLTGSGSDADGNALQYIWEQYDTGSSSSRLSNMVDNGSRPLFRSWQLTTNPERYLPDLQDYAAGNLQIGETMPTTNRDLNFRFTVRDGEGGVATDEMTVTVVADGSAFKVTQPVSGTVLESGTSSFVRWDVSGTNEAPISCSSVDILMSDNGFDSFDIIVAEGTPNDGEHEFTVGDFTSTNSAVMVRCATSGFYALSEAGIFVVAEGTDISTVDTSNTGSGSTDSGNTDNETTDNSVEAEVGTVPRSNDDGGGFSMNLLFLGLLLSLAAFTRRSRSKIAAK